MLYKYLTGILVFISCYSFGQSFEEIQQKYTEGLIAYQAGDTRKASQLLESTVSMAQGSFGSQSLEAAMPMGALGLIYTDMGKYAKAEPLLIGARQIVGQSYGKNNESYAATCTNLFNLYGEQGLYEQAEIYALESHKVITSYVSKDRADYGKSYFNLGSLYVLKQEYAKAESYFEEADKAWQGVVAGDDLMIAALNSGRAHAAWRQGRYEKAKGYYQKALAIESNTIGENHINYARTCNNYSALLYASNNTKLAIEFAEKAIGIYNTQLGESHPNLSIMLRNLSIAYVDNEEIDRALALAKMSVRIAKDANSTSIEYARACIHLGMIHMMQEAYDLAEIHFRESREIFEIQGNTYDADYLKVINASALLNENRKQLDAAQGFHYKANLMTLEIIERQFTTLSEEEKRLFFKTFGYNLGTYYSFVTKRYLTNPDIAQEAYNMILATKGLLFESTDKIRRRIKESNDSSLKKLFADWQSKRKEISKAQMLTSTERAIQGINLSNMENQANRLEKSLATQSSLFSKFQDQTQPTWGMVQQQLKPGEAAIELVRLSYWEKEWQDSTIYMALILKPERLEHPEIEIIGNGDYLETKGLSKYQKSIQFKVDDMSSYQTYWKPLADKLNGVQKVYLASDGVYNSISINGLLNPETNHYLYEELEVTMVKSTRDLLKPTKKESRSGRKAKLLGYPNYNSQKRVGSHEIDYFDLRSIAKTSHGDTSTRFFNGSTIPLLPGTKQEIENLVSIFERAGIPTDEYLDNEASESAIKSWKSPIIAHIATHGYFLKDRDLTSHKDKIGGISSEALLQNPLLRSGLLFAGAQSAISDGGEGVLTAYEAMNLDFDDTELVVLSACETGLGEIRNGEGVYGLQRAFQAAGAKTIIMSLWTVNDDATQKLMTAFYSYWLSDGLSKRKAFQMAQSDLAVAYPHPYYWAAFVLIGAD